MYIYHIKRDQRLPRAPLQVFYIKTKFIQGVNRQLIWGYWVIWTAPKRSNPFHKLVKPITILHNCGLYYATTNRPNHQEYEQCLQCLMIIQCTCRQSSSKVSKKSGCWLAHISPVTDDRSTLLQLNHFHPRNCFNSAL